MKWYGIALALLGIGILVTVLAVGYFTPASRETFLWLGVEFTGAGVGLVLLLAGAIGAFFAKPRQN